MKSLVAVHAFLLILCLIGANGRHVEQDEYEHLSEADEQAELVNRRTEHEHGTQRHRRRPRQMHGYDYPRPFYYDDRRDYNMRQQEEQLSQIIRSLDEIISNIRRPPPPPQPVYIPYPVIQYVPCGYRPQNRPAKPVSSGNTTQIPTFTDRFPVIEDENQLWGGPVNEIPEEVESDDDGSRPISLLPIKPSTPTSRPPPVVDHGSNQAGNEQSTAAPVRRPGSCETAIITCCSLEGRTAQRSCFGKFGCSRTYATNRACDPAVIKRVLENFVNAYAPVNNE